MVTWDFLDEMRGSGARPALCLSEPAEHCTSQAGHSLYTEVSSHGTSWTLRIERFFDALLGAECISTELNPGRINLNGQSLLTNAS